MGFYLRQFPPQSGVQYKEEIMPYNLLGKILFPHQQRDERTRKAKMVVGVVLASLVVGGSLGVFFYLQNARPK